VAGKNIFPQKNQPTEKEYIINESLAKRLLKD